METKDQTLKAEAQKGNTSRDPYRLEFDRTFAEIGRELDARLKEFKKGENMTDFLDKKE